MRHNWKKWGKDAAERVLGAFIYGASGVIMLVGVDGLSEARTWKAAAAGGAVAVVSLLKSWAAAYRGDPSSASLSKDV
jgi:hypothetical protein